MRAKQKNKIRKSTKYIGTFISIALLILSFISLMKNISNENIKTRTEEIYNYTNKFSYDYNVNIIDNIYIQPDTEKDVSIVYVTDLIDTTDLTLNYEYIADKETELKYIYSVIGRTQAVYIKDGEEQKIIDEEEIILEEQTKEVLGDEINIKETLLPLNPIERIIPISLRESTISIEIMVHIIPIAKMVKKIKPPLDAKLIIGSTL